MQHYAAFHLDLHCFQKYLFRGFTEYQGLSLKCHKKFAVDDIFNFPTKSYNFIVVYKLTLSVLKKVHVIGWSLIC